MAWKHKQRKVKAETLDCNGEEEFENGEEDGNDERAQKAGKGAEEKVDDDFNLDEVLRLGGTKADYIMLASLNDCEDLVDGGKKNIIDDLKAGELEEFITKLGIRGYSEKLHVINDPDEEKTPPGGAKNKDEQLALEKKTSKVVKKEVADTKKEERIKTKKKVNAEVKEKKNKLSTNVFEFHPRKIHLIKPGGKWYDLEYANEINSTAQDVSLVSQYKLLAQKLFEMEVELFKSKKNAQKGANSAWMKTVVSTGTLPDRMAAMTLLIQDAPIHTIHFVENLVSLVKKKGGRRQSLMALDTLRELLMSNLLPEHRKLRTFSQHPFDTLEKLASGNRDTRDRRLILWYFEHLLKHHMAEFVVALDTLSHDTVMATKMHALKTAHELLCNRPEQEKALLIQVVNKLGDPEYKVASKASYLLEVLLHKHPNMKAVVCSEVERLMFRPNISTKAQYYAICFLNQVLLSHEEAELASRLIAIYFTFFRACVKKKDVESKMLSGLLSGVNRAYPYAKEGDEKIKEQMDTLFKVVHVVKFSTALQALMLLFQVMNSQQIVSDRYYVALYRKLQDPGLSVCSRQGMFLNLLYKSLKADIVLRRVKAFVKRLLQVSCDQNPTFACGALFLVSEVIKAKPGLKLLLQENEDVDEEKFKDIEEDDDEDDGEERFTDADKMEEGQSTKSENPKHAASWVHHQNLGAADVATYDPMHRNPLYCGADHTTLWELQKLSAHYHPSVALFANTLLRGESIQYTGDPLQDFTLIRFLDRFVFRNPKQQKVRENIDSTAMQAKNKRFMNDIRSLPVNCEEYLAKEESQIPVDEIFFYRFFKKREKEKLLRRPWANGDNESVEDVDDDEFENALNSFEGDSYYSAFKDDDLDFAGNVKGKSKKNQKVGEDSDVDSDLDEAEDLDDEEVSLGSMEEEDFGDELEDEGGAFMDLEGGDADEDGEEEISQASDAFKKGKRKKSQQLDFSGQKRKKGMKSEDSVFASAEEFGYLLDENAGSKFDNIGIDAMANKDKASIKQLKWEVRRDDWIHGRDDKTLRRKKASFKRKPFGKMKGGKNIKGRRS